MENETKPQETPKSNGWRKWIMIALAIYSVLLLVLFYFVIADLHNKLEAKDNLILKESMENNTCTYKRDSLIREVKNLSIYKSLTKAMVHRDEATSLLPHEVGYNGYLKRDSSRIVISDVIIGGSKYQYYIKYKVIHTDNSSEEVDPSLVY